MPDAQRTFAFLRNVLAFLRADAGDLVGKTIPPGVLSAPADLDLGGAELSSTPASKLVELVNTGGAATGAISFSLDGSDKAEFSVVFDHCTGQTLAPGARCNAEVRLTPTVRGALVATLTATATPGGNAVVRLQGRGLAPATMQLSKTSLEFSSVPPLSTRSLSIVVQNVGDVAGNLWVNDRGLDELFSVTNGCAQPFYLGPGARCTLTINFAPDLVGDYDTHIDLQLGNAPAVTIPLGGHAVSATNLISSTRGLFFSDLTLPQESFVVTNVTPKALTLTSAIAGDPCFAIFIDRCNGKKLEPRATCKIDVTVNAPGTDAELYPFGERRRDEPRSKGYEIAAWSDGFREGFGSSVSRAGARVDRQHRTSRRRTG
jgi:hypothetical protein